MSDIDAPNSSADEDRLDTPNAEAAPADATDTDAAETGATGAVDAVQSSVDDLLRDIGATCGAPVDTKSDEGSAPDWFARAVDDLASGRVPDAVPPPATEPDPPPGPSVQPDAPEPEAVSAPIPEAVPTRFDSPDDDEPDMASIETAPSESVVSATDRTPAPAPASSDAQPLVETAPESHVETDTEADPFAGASFTAATLDAPESGEPDVVAEAPATTATPLIAEAPAPDAARAGPAISDDDLRALDDELAGDVGELLQGNFDTVSAVLDDSFDGPEVALLREAGSTPDQPEAASSVSASTDPAPAPAARASEPLPSRHDPEAEHVPQTVSELLDPVEREPAGEMLPDRAAPSVPDPEPTPESESQPGSAKEADSTNAASPEAVVTASTAPEDEPLRSPSGLMALLMEILAIISFPLRFVPPPLRPVVDWVALSLVFWVPIVWVIALFMVGQTSS